MKLALVSHILIPRVFVSRAFVMLLCLLALSAQEATAKKRRVPQGGRVAVIVDERLAVLRDAPGLSGALVQRLGRGRMVSVAGARRMPDGISFYRVAVTSRTGGWLQAESLAAPWREGDDARLLRLVRGSEEFDRLERAQIFLETFPRSPLRPAVLLLLGDAAESAAARLSRDAVRRLDAREMAAGGAPPHTYFLSYNGLDRYRRLGIRFTFDAARKQFHYDGAAWLELLRRHPQSTEAEQARARLATLRANRD